MMLSDDILATFYIEQSDLVSCCGGRFCYTKPCKIMFHTLREEVCARRNLWEKSANGYRQLSKISGIYLCASGKKFIFCGIYFCELKNVSKFCELSFSNVTSYEFIIKLFSFQCYLLIPLMFSGISKVNNEKKSVKLLLYSFFIFFKN